jgi:hypothetical protein
VKKFPSNIVSPTRTRACSEEQIQNHRKDKRKMNIYICVYAYIHMHIHIEKDVPLLSTKLMINQWQVANIVSEEQGIGGSDL